MRAAAGDHFNVRSNAIAIAFRSLQLDRNPVTFAGRDIVYQRAPRAKIHQERIHLAVIVVVGKAGAARHSLHSAPDPLARDIREFTLAESLEKRMLLRNQVNQSAVENQNVRLAIIVEVVNAGSPTHVLRVRLRYARLRAHVVKPAFAGVVQQPVVVAVRHPQIQAARPSRSANTGPIDDVDSPFWPNATSAWFATSSNVPSCLLWKRKFSVRSLAT